MDYLEQERRRIIAVVVQYCCDIGDEFSAQELAQSQQGIKTIYLLCNVRKQNYSYRCNRTPEHLFCLYYANAHKGQWKYRITY